MIKIFLTVRNRLAITKKCIEAIQRHSTKPYQLYVYNNQTNYKLKEHYQYFYKLQMEGQITQVTFNTDASTYNAFSKASACNQFGLWHQQDPKKDDYAFLLMLDNDIILTPAWDQKLNSAWKFIKKSKNNDIKVIGQSPGGVKYKKTTLKINEEMQGRVGKLGGSGLWSVRPNFFEDVGFLDLKLLIGFNKKHDQHYWRLLDKTTGGKPYIMALNQKIGIHCGRMSASVCNKLTHNSRASKDEKLKLIRFEEAEERIDKVSFDDFYNKIINDKALFSDW
jgi:hypothetical protein